MLSLPLLNLVNFGLNSCNTVILEKTRRKKYQQNKLIKSLWSSFTDVWRCLKRGKKERKKQQQNSFQETLITFYEKFIQNLNGKWEVNARDRVVNWRLSEEDELIIHFTNEYWENLRGFWNRTAAGKKRVKQQWNPPNWRESTLRKP